MRLMSDSLTLQRVMRRCIRYSKTSLTTAMFAVNHSGCNVVIHCLSTIGQRPGHMAIVNYKRLLRRSIMHSGHKENYCFVLHMQACKNRQYR